MKIVNVVTKYTENIIAFSGGLTNNSTSSVLNCMLFCFYWVLNKYTHNICIIYFTTTATARISSARVRAQ